MQLKVFTVYDSKAEAYMQPFYMQTTGQALRAFEDTVNDPDHQFHKHPADFTLFELGIFNDITGTFHLTEAKKSLTSALEVLGATSGATSFNQIKPYEVKKS